MIPQYHTLSTFHHSLVTGLSQVYLPVHLPVPLPVHIFVPLPAPFPVLLLFRFVFLFMRLFIFLSFVLSDFLSVLLFEFLTVSSLVVLLSVNRPKHGRLGTVHAGFESSAKSLDHV